MWVLATVTPLGASAATTTTTAKAVATTTEATATTRATGARNGGTVGRRTNTEAVARWVDQQTEKTHRDTKHEKKLEEVESKF